MRTGRSGALSEEIAQRQIHECSLAAEVAADGGDMDDDFFSRDADRVRETLLGVVRNFIAYPYVNRSCLPIDGDHARMGLQIGLMNVLGRKSIFENVIGIAKSLLDIPESPLVMRIDIVDGRAVIRQPLVVLQPLVQLRRAFGDRHQRIENGGQLFILDFDQLRRFFRDVAVLGRHDGHFLADEAHAISRQHGHVSQPSAGQYRGNIRRGEYGQDSRIGSCPPGIDATNASVRIGAAQDFAPYRARQKIIGCVKRFSGNFRCPSILGAALPTEENFFFCSRLPLPFFTGDLRLRFDFKT